MCRSRLVLLSSYNQDHKFGCMVFVQNQRAQLIFISKKLKNIQLTNLAVVSIPDKGSTSDPSLYAVAFFTGRLVLIPPQEHTDTADDDVEPPPFSPSPPPMQGSEAFFFTHNDDVMPGAPPEADVAPPREEQLKQGKNCNSNYTFVLLSCII